MNLKSGNRDLYQLLLHLLMLSHLLVLVSFFGLLAHCLQSLLATYKRQEDDKCTFLFLASNEMKELKRFVRGLIIEMRKGHPTETTV